MIGWRVIVFSRNCATTTVGIQLLSISQSIQYNPLSPLQLFVAMMIIYMQSRRGQCYNDKTKMHMSAAVCSNHLYPPHHYNHHDCWVAVTVHMLLPRGRVFRLNSSCALLLQLPIASLAPAPGIVIRDGCGRNVHGACTYAFARLAGRGVASRGSSSST